MFWTNDEWEDAYDEIVYTSPEEKEEEDENAQYCDVPLPYRPVEIYKPPRFYR